MGRVFARFRSFHYSDIEDGEFHRNWNNWRVRFSLGGRGENGKFRRNSRCPFRVIAGLQYLYFINSVFKNTKK